MSFINIVYAMLADYFIFEENLNSMEIGAAVVIFSTTLIVALLKMRKTEPDHLDSTRDEIEEVPPVK